MEHVQNLMSRFELTWLQVGFSLVILFAAYFLNQILLKFSLYLYQQQVLWLRKLRFWVPLVRIIIWFSSIFFAIRVLHPPTELLFALATSAGVAVGLAAQELVKYIFGTVIIWADRVYQEGDRVTIGDVEGIVQTIGLRSTKVWAFDDTIIVIPNSKLLDVVVYNANSGAPSEQILIDLYVPLDADTDKAAKLARLAAISCDLVEPLKPVGVLVNDYFEKDTPFSRIRLKVYVRNIINEKRLVSDVTTKAKRLFRENGIYSNTSEPQQNQEHTATAQ